MAVTYSQEASREHAPLSMIKFHLALASGALGPTRHNVQDVLCCPPSDGLTWQALLEAGCLAHAYDNSNQTMHCCCPPL